MKQISFRRIERELSPGIKVIRYHMNGTDPREGFYLGATRHGVELGGVSLTLNREEDLQVLAKHVAIAWQEFRRMKDSTDAEFAEQLDVKVGNALSAAKRAEDGEAATDEGASSGT